MHDFDRSDELHFQAACGWLELGSWLEANSELENISPLQRAHPDVLALRIEVYSQAKRWDACVEIAEGVLKIDPTRLSAWIHRSYALHELQRTQEAFDRLLPCLGRFADVWTIPYNLACYCAQLNDLAAAEQWLKQAIATDETSVKHAAIDDPDLKPLWDSMSGTFWKRE